VYLGTDPELEREVAIKVPKVEELTPEFRESFLRENRLAAIIQHPNICPVYEVGTDGGFPYIVMRVVPSTLAALLKRLPAPMPPKSAAAVARKLALGLTAAHAQKVIHRDLKPANVLYDEANREVLIADFGLARLADQATDASNGVPKGTPAYMAPEQARGQADKVGPLSDVYSLGVMLYELLTGKVPFTGSVWEVMRDHCETTPPAPSQVRPGVDPELDAVVAKAMAKHPADRFPGAKAFAQALGDYLLAAERGGGSVPLFSMPAPEPEAKPKGPGAKPPSAPSFEVVAPKPKPVPAPVPKPVAVTVDEDDEEDEAAGRPEKPVKRKEKKGKRKKKKGGVPVAVWAGAGAVAVLLLAVALIAGKRKSDAGTRPGPIATGPTEAERKEAERREAEKREAEKKFLQAEADLRAGDDLFNGQNGKARDYAKARELYESAAALGNLAAQYKLGQLHAGEHLGAKDEATARKWYTKAAEQGHAGAQNAIGMLLYYGQGGAKDPPRAREWWEKAAAQNHHIAQSNLGVYYANQGSKDDYAKAREWYRKAGEQGYAEAQNRLGDLYFKALGGPRDDNKAREWYEKAANQGHPAGQRNLGRAFEFGLGAVYDQVAALAWYRKAAAQGDVEAIQAIARMQKSK
jgi:serine/threonine protein kinase